MSQQKIDNKVNNLHQWCANNETGGASLGDSFFIKRFYSPPPCIKNETQSSMNGHLDIMKVNLIRHVHKPQEEVNKSIDIPEDYDSDDSINDPDYCISSFEISTDTSSESDNEILVKMGRQIEKALVNSNHNEIESSKPDEQTGEPLQPIKSKRVRQVKRNSGKSYVTNSGKLIKERQCFKMEYCRNKCKEKVLYEDQKKIFEQYWQLSTYNNRILYIASLIDITEKSSQTLKKSHKPKNRQNTILYYLELNGDKIRVCQKCFKNVLEKLPVS